MLERQREGIAKARAENRFLGRKPEVNTALVWRRILAGESPTALAADLGVSRSSIYRHAPNVDELAVLRAEATPEAREASIRNMIILRAADPGFATRMPQRKG